MVLAFHNINIDQARIAQLMNIPEDPEQGGVGSNAQLPVYTQLSAGQLRIMPDNTPTVAECIAEIHAGRPLKSGRAQHARVFGGWCDTEYGVMYQVFDPYPVDQGKIGYENPKVIYSLNFVYAHPV